LSGDVPKVSVVLPTHNRVELLPLSLASVLRQKGVELEAIVVNDGSTDGTRAFLERSRDPRVRVIHHPVARGVSAARNAGIADARGTVLAFIDDDDLWAPDKLRLQLRAMHESARVWAYAGSVYVDLHGRIRGGTPPMEIEPFVRTLPHWNPMPAGCSNAIVGTQTLERVGAFDETLQILADWDLWLRLSQVDLPALVSRPLVGYRVHNTNMSLDTRKLVAELEIMRERYGSSIDRTRFLRYASTLALRRRHWAEAARLTLEAAAAAPPRRVAGELASSVGALASAVGRAAHRRLLRVSARQAARHHRRMLAIDPNIAWKSEAKDWLGPLLASTEGGRSD
jgi:glycosyltransferase involved in cell wall biosynthesis